MRKTLLSLLVALLVSPLTAQAIGFGAGGVFLGLNILNMTELNNVMTPDGYNSLKDNNLFFGGGGYGVIYKHIILGGSGGGFVTQDIDKTGVTGTMRGGYGVFNFGYSLFRTRFLHLFPYGGFGGGGIQLELVPDSGGADFGDIVNNPKQFTILTRNSVCLDAGVEADFLIPLGLSDTGSGGFLLGLRVGYLYFPTNASWKLAGNKVPGGPDTWLTGPYVHIVLGGFGRSAEPK
jgi:hypothetical protein